MRIEVWPTHGPQNSKEIFKKFIKSLQDSGDKVSIDKETNGDIALSGVCSGKDVCRATNEYGIGIGMQGSPWS